MFRVAILFSMRRAISECITPLAHCCLGRVVMNSTLQGVRRSAKQNKPWIIGGRNHLQVRTGRVRCRSRSARRRWKYTVTEHINGKNCSATLTFLKMDGRQSTRIMENSCIHSPETAKVHVCPIPPPPPPLVLVGISPAFDAISCGERWMVAKNAYFYISYPFGGELRLGVCGSSIKSECRRHPVHSLPPALTVSINALFLRDARFHLLAAQFSISLRSPSAASRSRVSELCPDLWAARLISFLECIAAEWIDAGCCNPRRNSNWKVSAPMIYNSEFLAAAANNGRGPSRRDWIVWMDEGLARRTPCATGARRLFFTPNFFTKLNDRHKFKRNEKDVKSGAWRKREAIDECFFLQGHGFPVAWIITVKMTLKIICYWLLDRHCTRAPGTNFGVKNLIWFFSCKVNLLIFLCLINNIEHTW